MNADAAAAAAVVEGGADADADALAAAAVAAAAAAAAFGAARAGAPTAGSCSFAAWTALGRGRSRRNAPAAPTPNVRLRCRLLSASGRMRRFAAGCWRQHLSAAVSHNKSSAAARSSATSARGMRRGPGRRHARARRCPSPRSPWRRTRGAWSGAGADPSCTGFAPPPATRCPGWPCPRLQTSSCCGASACLNNCAAPSPPQLKPRRGTRGGRGRSSSVRVSPT
mmetsp:Transcript_28582/g.84619  ORF Transcript_28582/g.84619 Transcript_28582/m.84619 type:complete len:224 (+) Transcript_28582:2590-3261(+)